MLQKGIDICICTYNRVEYLQQCVELLIPQLEENVMLTIVDNNSTDNTGNYIQSLLNSDKHIRGLFESVQGLSHARNKGWKESEYEWILYLDDDSVPGPDLVRQALECTIDYANLAAMGGPIYPVFSSPPPAWVPEHFGKFEMPFDQLTVIDTGYIRGGCFLIQKKILEKLGGFKTDLGIQGNRLAYGEEIELQDRMRSDGLLIGYHPKLKIGHHVRIEKISPRWILFSEYARRRDKMMFAPIGLGKAFAGTVRTIGGRILRVPVYSYRLISNRDYTLNHAILDFMKPVMYRGGELIGVIKNLFR